MCINRREFFKISIVSVATLVLPSKSTFAIIPTQTLRIALLHLAPVTGDLAYNRRMVETAITTAATSGADWIITPELCTCGYAFADQIGTDWIRPQPDTWMRELCQRVKQLQVTVFISHPERDRQTEKLYNSMFVIGPNGAILGKHRKIRTIKHGSESWAHPGEKVVPIPVKPFDNVGIIICADAYTPWIAKRLKAQGAQILISAAAWGPGPHGPDGEWERCTRETGLPLIVCNRTGIDRTMDFTGSESVIVKDGRRLQSFRSERSAIFTVDWDLKRQTLVTQAYQRTCL